MHEHEKTLCQVVSIIHYFPGQRVLNVINILLAVMATCGNALIIVSVLRCRHLRSQTPTIFIISLALSDFLVGAIVQPLFSVLLIDWSLETCSIHRYKIAIAFFTCSVSIGNALCVCLDRMLRITKPFTYELYVTRKRAFMACISFWCGGIGIGYMAFETSTQQMMAYGALAEMTISFLIGFYCAAKVYKVGQEQIKRISKNKIGDEKQRILMERKLAGSLVAVLATIIICWVPFAIVNILTFHVYDESNWLVFLSVKTWTILIGYSKSTINIFIFGLTNREIKKAIRNILQLEQSRHPSSVALNSYGSVSVKKMGMDNEGLDVSN